jgi:hypothetical protein
VIKKVERLRSDMLEGVGPFGRNAAFFHKSVVLLLHGDSLLYPGEEWNFLSKFFKKIFQKFYQAFSDAFLHVESKSAT